MVSKKELDLILSGSFRWITVKKFNPQPSTPYSELYEQLEAHHINETTFLIDKVKELAQQVKDLTPDTTETLLPGMDGVKVIKSHPQMIREDKWK